MGPVIASLAMYTLLVVFPFKLTASWLGADRSDWSSCFVAVLLAGALGGGASGLFGGGLTLAFFGGTQGVIALALTAMISGLVNRFVLGTTLLRGVAITTIGALVVPGVLIGTLLLVGWMKYA